MLGEPVTERFYNLLYGAAKNRMVAATNQLDEDSRLWQTLGSLDAFIEPLSVALENGALDEVTYS